MSSNSFEHFRPLLQIADEVHPVGLPPGQKRFERISRRIARHRVIHEPGVGGALCIVSLKERRVRHVAGLQSRELTHLRSEERAALTLVWSRLACMPHVQICNEDAAAFERLQ
jgi:hypothetical protein